ncbi:hypothetical protein TWF481_011616 [Arthrobotrys musiformis]|uniref:Peptidase A1 domain-containing protein n=1 Tax=Arthrobotrys musiformis TaxID=47236 RepID=A0AAV9W002_9PEZI
MRDHTRFGVVVSIFLFLLSFAYVAQQHGNTTAKALGFRGSVFSRVKRADKNHVVLETEFNLRLSVTPQHVTWVPQKPGSEVDFCNSEPNINPQNERACSAAGKSGFYRPAGYERTNPFSFDESYLDFSVNETATGYWVEDAVTADGINVKLQFGVALDWHSSPILGLGLQPINQNPRRPGYIDALKQQGKITGRFCSLYNHLTPNTTGEIVLGGVDTKKFKGKLAVWQRMGFPGEVEAPSFRVTNGTGLFKGPFENPGKPLAIIDPLARSLFIPRNMHKELLSVLSAYGLERNLYLPCDRNYSLDEYIELVFNETVIRIQFNDLKGLQRNSSLSLCELSVFPTEDYININKWSFILGGPFFRSAYTVFGIDTNSTGIGVLNPAPVGRNIIELGGSFGTTLDKVEGDDSSPPPSDSGSALSPGAIAGVVIAVVLVLITAVGIFFFLRRRRKNVPEIPHPEGYPPELSPDVRPMSELEAKSAAPISYELPAYSATATAYELEANTRP